MTLRLSVVSEHGIRPGRAIHQGVRRAWRHHWARRPTTRGFYPTPSDIFRENTCASIFRAGTYVLVDTSSNGTYVNGAQVPLGKYHDYVLKDGDYVRLGEYELLVSIDKSNDFPPDDASHRRLRRAIAPSAAVKKSTANDFGADLDLSELLEPSDQFDVDTGIRRAMPTARP